MLVAKKELDYYTEQIESEEKKVNKKHNKNKNYIAAYRLMLLGAAIIGLLLSLFILFRYADITKIRLEITELENQKIQLQKEKDNLIAELEAIKSSKKIEEDAMSKLGMSYPTEEQIVYVDVDELSIKDEIEQNKEFSLIGELKNIMNLVLGLF